MKLAMLYEQFGQANFNDHTRIYNQIISPLETLARSRIYDENKAKDLLISLINMISLIPWGPMDKIEETRIRERMIKAAQTTYAKATQDNLLKFSFQLSVFWLKMGEVI